LGFQIKCINCPGWYRADSSSEPPSPGRWPTIPPLLVADEPTGNLDVQTSEEVFEILLKLTGRGKPSSW
jgi:hypothetical protein